MTSLPRADELGSQILVLGIISGGAEVEAMSWKRWAARVEKGSQAARAHKLKS